MWIVHYRGNELENGVVATGPPHEANIANFVTGEAVDDHDVVVWYGAHSPLDLAIEPPSSFNHIIGPDLKRVKW